MADLTKVTGVANADISKVDGVAAASIEKIVGVDKPSATLEGRAIIWVCAGHDRHVATATASVGACFDADGESNADEALVCGYRTWTEYTRPSNNSEHQNIFFGLDSSADDIWVTVSQHNTQEICYTDDILTAGWSTFNPSGGDLKAGDWGNDMFIVAGEMSTQQLITSSDGSTWGTLSISAVGTLTTATVYSMVTDGEGLWAFGQEDRLYTSSNDGTTWGIVHDFNDGRLIRDLAHTKDTGSNSVFAMAYNTGGSNDGHAAAAKTGDLTTWFDTADLGVTDIGGTIYNIGGGGGTFIAVNSNDQLRSTDAGDTWTHGSNTLAQADVESVETDGYGVWITGHQAGRIAYSTDDGITWRNAPDTGGEKWTGVACNVTTKDKK